jgi:hypothetical protein
MKKESHFSSRSWTIRRLFREIAREEACETALTLTTYKRKSTGCLLEYHTAVTTYSEIYFQTD